MTCALHGSRAKVSPVIVDLTTEVEHRKGGDDARGVEPDALLSPSKERNHSSAPQKKTWSSWQKTSAKMAQVSGRCSWQIWRGSSGKPQLRQFGHATVASLMLPMFLWVLCAWRLTKSLAGSEQTFSAILLGRMWVAGCFCNLLCNLVCRELRVTVSVDDVQCRVRGGEEILFFVASFCMVMDREGNLRNPCLGHISMKWRTAGTLE